ncbi:hypothetical protein [Leeia oryzae]|uniref:hypothetical protein n=1 Tax=Leeia oryzae TaxID=356662 RepID=UPI0012EA517A|nr:hypothetical protein [Leeia oryzae]
MPTRAETVSQGLEAKIAELETLSHKAESPLVAEKFRKSAFRLRTMQTESTLYELIGRRVLLGKFRHRKTAQQAIAQLGLFARSGPEHMQVAALHKQLQQALLASTLPFILLLALLLFCAIWIYY